LDSMAETIPHAPTSANLENPRWQQTQSFNAQRNREEARIEMRDLRKQRSSITTRKNRRGKRQDEPACCVQKHPLFFGLVVRRGGQRARPLRGGEANQQAMPPSARCSCGLTAWPAGHSLIRSRRPSCDGLTTPGMRAPTAMSSRETSARGRQGRVPSPSAPTAAASARRGACCAVGTRAPGTRPAACCRPRSRRPGEKFLPSRMNSVCIDPVIS